MNRTDPDTPIPERARRFMLQAALEIELAALTEPATRAARTERVDQIRRWSRLPAVLRRRCARELHDYTRGVR